MERNRRVGWRGSPTRTRSKGKIESVTDGQQLNLPLPIVAVIITATVSILIFVITNWWNGERARLTRSREISSKAYASIQEYKEFPYVIRRRRKDAPEEERMRISSELRRVQADLAFYSAWLRTESPYVHRCFDDLLVQVRNTAGKAMHNAWLEPPAEDDSNMNMPDLGLSTLTPYESAYLEEVVDHLSFWPRWLRRLLRSEAKGSS